MTTSSLRCDICEDLIPARQDVYKVELCEAGASASEVRSRAGGILVVCAGCLEYDAIEPYHKARHCRDCGGGAHLWHHQQRGDSPDFLTCRACGYEVEQ